MDLRATVKTRHGAVMTANPNLDNTVNQSLVSKCPNQNNGVGFMEQGWLVETPHGPGQVVSVQDQGSQGRWYDIVLLSNERPNNVSAQLLYQQVLNDKTVAETTTSSMPTVISSHNTCYPSVHPEVGSQVVLLSCFGQRQYHHQKSSSLPMGRIQELRSTHAVVRLTSWTLTTDDTQSMTMESLHKNSVQCFVKYQDLQVMTPSNINDLSLMELWRLVQERKQLGQHHATTKDYTHALQEYQVAMVALRTLLQTTKDDNHKEEVPVSPQVSAMRANWLLTKVKLCTLSTEACLETNNPTMAVSYSMQALALLKSLQDSKTGHHPQPVAIPHVTEETAHEALIGEVRVFGSWRVKCLKHLATALVALKEYKVAQSIIKQGLKTIQLYTSSTAAKENKLPRQRLAHLQKYKRQLQKMQTVVEQEVRRESVQRLFAKVHRQSTMETQEMDSESDQSTMTANRDVKKHDLAIGNVTHDNVLIAAAGQEDDDQSTASEAHNPDELPQIDIGSHDQEEETKMEDCSSPKSPKRLTLEEHLANTSPKETVSKSTSSVSLADDSNASTAKFNNCKVAVEERRERMAELAAKKNAMGGEGNTNTTTATGITTAALVAPMIFDRREESMELSPLETSTEEDLVRALEALEEPVQDLAEVIAAAEIQRVWRGQVARKECAKTQKAALLLQSFAKSCKAKKAYAEWKHAVETVQRVCLGYAAKLQLRKTLLAVVVLQSFARSKMAQNKYTKAKSSATKIQNMWRGMSARSDFQTAVVAVVVLQSFARSKMARMKYTLVKSSATKIQNVWRGMSARSLFQAAVAAAVVLQSFARSKMARMKYTKAKSSATKIQNVWRGMSARSDFQAAVAAVSLLQSMARGSLSRRSLTKARAGATAIQSVMRARSNRRVYLRRLSSVVVLQSAIRGANARRSLAASCKSATDIQRISRGYMARRQFGQTVSYIITLQSMLRAAKAKQDVKDRKKSATEIQKIYRGSVARTEYKKAVSSVVLLQSLVRAWHVRTAWNKVRTSAIQIQRLYRGEKSRSSFRAAVSSAVLLQSFARSSKCRRDLESARCSAICIQRVGRGVICRSTYEQKRSSVLVMQAAFRASVARASVQKSLNGIVLVQRVLRGYLCRQKYAQLQSSAVVIQSLARKVAAQNELAKSKESALLLQRVLRGFEARERYSLLKSNVLVLKQSNSLEKQEELSVVEMAVVAAECEPSNDVPSEDDISAAEQIDHGSADMIMSIEVESTPIAFENESPEDEELPNTTEVESSALEDTVPKGSEKSLKSPKEQLPSLLEQMQSNTPRTSQTLASVIITPEQDEKDSYLPVGDALSDLVKTLDGDEANNSIDSEDSVVPLPIISPTAEVSSPNCGESLSSNDDDENEDTESKPVVVSDTEVDTPAPQTVTDAWVSPSKLQAKDDEWRDHIKPFASQNLAGGDGWRDDIKPFASKTLAEGDGWRDDIKPFASKTLTEGDGWRDDIKAFVSDASSEVASSKPATKARSVSFSDEVNVNYISSQQDGASGDETSDNESEETVQVPVAAKKSDVTRNAVLTGVVAVGVMVATKYALSSKSR